MSSQGSSESCRLQYQRHKTTGHKKCRKLDTVRPGKREAVQGNRKDLNFAAGLPRTRTQFSILTMWFHWNTQLVWNLWCCERIAKPQTRECQIKKEIVSLLKNVALKNWQFAANAVPKHSELSQYIQKALICGVLKLKDVHIFFGWAKHQTKA